MAARVTLIDNRDGSKHPMFSVDAKELLEGERRAVKLGKQEKVNWSVDMGARTPRPMSDDDKITMIREAEEKEARERREATNLEAGSPTPAPGAPRETPIVAPQPDDLAAVADRGDEFPND